MLRDSLPTHQPPPLGFRHSWIQRTREWLGCPPSSWIRRGHPFFRNVALTQISLTPCTRTRLHCRGRKGSTVSSSAVSSAFSITTFNSQPIPPVTSISLKQLRSSFLPEFCLAWVTTEGSASIPPSPTSPKKRVSSCRMIGRSVQNLPSTSVCAMNGALLTASVSIASSTATSTAQVESRSTSAAGIPPFRHSDSEPPLCAVLRVFLDLVLTGTPRSTEITGGHA